MNDVLKGFKKSRMRYVSSSRTKIFNFFELHRYVSRVSIYIYNHSIYWCMHIYTHVCVYKCIYIITCRLLVHMYIKKEHDTAHNTFIYLYYYYKEEGKKYIYIFYRYLSTGNKV